MLIICPFNRPEKYNHIINSWEKQNIKSDLCLIANDMSIFPKDKNNKVIHITGQASIGGARNAGLQLARKNNYDWCIFWDDDNYHSSKYLSSFKNNIDDDIDVLSLGIAFVRFNDGNLHLFKSPLDFAPGHSSAVRVSKAVDFPELNLSEDVQWSKDMKKLGFNFKKISPWYAIYNRVGEGHAYSASKTEFMASFKESYLIGKVPDDFVDDPKNLDDYKTVSVKDEEIWNMLNQYSTFNFGVIQ